MNPLMELVICWSDFIRCAIFHICKNIRLLYDGDHRNRYRRQNFHCFFLLSSTKAVVFFSILTQICFEITTIKSVLSFSKYFLFLFFLKIFVIDLFLQHDWSPFSTISSTQMRFDNIYSTHRYPLRKWQYLVVFPYYDILHIFLIKKKIISIIIVISIITFSYMIFIIFFWYILYILYFYYFIFY